MSNNIHYNKSYKDHIFDKDKDKDNDKDNYIDSIHYLNVDTRLINKGSVNILNNEYIKTDNNISFTENSSILNINIPSHNFILEDRIIIKNVNGINITNRNILKFIINSRYV